MYDIGSLWIRWPFAKIRREIGREHGSVTMFVIQLEYDVEAGYSGMHTPNWKQVARFDHNPELGQGHDVREEGLHLDIYRDGEKVDVKRGFPHVDINDAPAFCEKFLSRNAEQLLKRYEQWHDINGPFSDYSSP